MSLFTYAVRRAVVGAVAAFVAVSVTFLLVATHRFHPVEAPLYEQFLGHVVGILQFQWGYSESLGRPVGDVLAAAIPRTLAYVVPAILFTYALGIAGGLIAAYGTDNVDAGVRVFAYALLGVPTMVLGSMIAFQLMGHVDWVSGPIWCTNQGIDRRCWPPFTAYNSPFLQPVYWGIAGAYGWPNTVPWRHLSYRYVLPAAVLSVGLATGLFRQARSAALEHQSSPVSKMLAAKGAPDVVDARHAVRNAALPLLSVSFAELMSVFAIWTFVVESVFHVPGIAAFVQIAVRTRDLPLLVGTTTVLALVGVAFSFVQDVLYGVLNPEIGE
ncbi:ABC transporter permease [Halobacterium zhouii]|uniref:ABC transporter permease n=1 Tax=Halobacterium zhouii TaxID=2902624 RepID=UPI001E55A46F|nr:ABC transporter permease [Halobacterium zhouii]